MGRSTLKNKGMALFVAMVLALLGASAALVATSTKAFADEAAAAQTTDDMQGTEETYKVTYKLNGGKNAKANAATYTGKLTFKSPTKKGYTFKGWYSDKKLTKRVKSVSGENITVYAKWAKKTYKVTYKLNGGKNSAKNPKKFTVTTKTTKLKSPTKRGYTFKGWYSDKYLTKKVTSIKKGTTGNITLYAKWVKTPTTKEQKQALKDTKELIAEMNRSGGELVTESLSYLGIEITSNVKKMGVSKQMTIQTME